MGLIGKMKGIKTGAKSRGGRPKGATDHKPRKKRKSPAKKSKST